MNILNKTIDKLSKKENSTRYYIGIYTILFVILCFAVYSSFIIFDKSFIWSTDGLLQHYPALTYIGIWGREVIRNFLSGDFTVPVWDFSIGYGADAIITMHYYGLGDPLSLLSIFVPSRYTEYLYDFLIILRLFLSGLGFILYCKKMKQDLRISILGSFIYIFCAYALLASVRHPFFLTPMVYFPVVLIGCEKIFKKENPLLFIAAVALCVLSNFYFAFMVIIMTVIYVVIRFAYMKHENFFKEMFVNLGKFAGFGVIAITISAILLLPIFIAFIGSSRSDASQTIPILYNISYYEKLFGSFMGCKSSGYWNWNGYTPISLVAVFYIFIKKGHYKPLKTAFIISLIIQIFPFFGYMLNGFLYVTNRFIWANAFLVAFITVYTFKDIINSTKEEKVKILIISCIYTLVFFVVREGKNVSTISQFVLLFAILLLIVGGNLLFDRYIYKYSSLSIAIISAIAIVINSTFCYSPVYSNYVSEFQDSGVSLNEIKSTPNYAFKDKINYSDTEFSRYELTTTKANQNLFNQSAGLSYYFSFNNDKIKPFLLEMEIPLIANYWYTDLSGRGFLTALTSTKHLIKNNTKAIPYNYKYVAKKTIDNKKYYLYENKSYLPLGYTYKSYITRDEYQKLSAVEKQEVLMQNILLEEKEDGFSQQEYTLTSQEIPFEIEYDKNIVQSENGIYVKKNNAVMKLHFKGIKNSETYLSFSNLNAEALDDYELIKATVQEQKTLEEESNYSKRLRIYNHFYKGITDKFNITVKGNNTSTVIRYRTPENSHYSDIHDFTINLGYSKKALKVCSVTFPEKGFYSWDNIKVVCQPMSNYLSYTQKLSEDVLENLKLEDNKVSGNISLKEDKILCLSIPYSAGWTCYVNGKETEILQANTWCMALPLTAGEYDINLVYSTPGLKIGAIVTSVGIILTIIICIFYVKRKKRNE